MEKWNDVRLSDEEYLGGIYLKAEAIENENAKEPVQLERSGRTQAYWQRKITAAACLAAAGCAVIVTGVLQRRSQLAKQENGTTLQNAMYRSIEESETEEPVEENTAPSEAELMRVHGTISSLEQDGDSCILYTSLDKNDYEMPKEIQIVISDELYEKLKYYEKEQGVDDLVNVQVLLYLESYNWKEYYKVNNDDGLYLKTQNEAGESVYMNMDGDVIEESEVMKK